MKTLKCLLALQTVLVSVSLHAGASASGELSKEVRHAQSMAEISRAHAELERYQDPEVKGKLKAVHLKQLEQASISTDLLIRQQTAQVDRLTADVAGHRSDLEIRRSLFANQNYYNVAIFVLVVIVVIAGLYFSYLQFASEAIRLQQLTRSAERIGRAKVDDATKGQMIAAVVTPPPNQASALELGPLKLTTTFVGLIVLSISLAFFYLYLIHVYAIKPEAVNRNLPVAAGATDSRIEAQLRVLKLGLDELKTQAATKPPTPPTTQQDQTPPKVTPPQ